MSKCASCLSSYFRRLLRPCALAFGCGRLWSCADQCHVELRARESNSSRNLLGSRFLLLPEAAAMAASTTAAKSAGVKVGAGLVTAR